MKGSPGKQYFFQNNEVSNNYSVASDDFVAVILCFVKNVSNLLTAGIYQNVMHT